MTTRTGKMRTRGINGTRTYETLHVARCCLVIAVIHRAFKDGCGGLTSDDTKRMTRVEQVAIVMDGYDYFYDGRYSHHAELIGLDPEMRPAWPG